ncbi:hypothetical protein B296_00010662 [Ensete ventricosum]|uniref:C3H1-type domain-containing protein n=1 Tax=Ensete ventricosum TaxID=4639 RepID=A0A427B9T6_ENSVE|nr:hypothetical protein B296_00010662 [Ensete ventricosum]
MSTCDGKICEGSVSVTVTVSFAGPLSRSLDRAGVKRERKGEIEWLAVIPLLVCGEESVSPPPPPRRPLDLAATLPGLCATLLRLVPRLFGDRDGWSTRAPARAVTEGPSLSSQAGTDEAIESQYYQVCRRTRSMIALMVAGMPSNAVVALRGSPVYPAVHSPTTPGQQTYPAEMTNWTLSRSSFIPSPRWQTSSSYAQLILPQGVVQVPGWTSYSGQMGSSPESQRTIGTAQFYGPSQQGETSIGAQGKFTSYQPGSAPMGLYAVPGENIFPERPGQPECQFYMKTGDCKFGAVCKFHHPKERLVPVPNCVLSPLGLPLRPVSLFIESLLINNSFMFRISFAPYTALVLY